MRFWSFLVLYLVLSGCAHRLSIHKESTNVGMDASYPAENSIQQIIQPYTDSLAEEMSVVLGKADTSFDISFPNSNLMNWAADALLQQETQHVKLKDPAIVLLNAGGLRSSLNPGNITVGDMYKLMPFDNVVAWVRLPVERIPGIEQNLAVQAKGVALSNARFEQGIS